VHSSRGGGSQQRQSERPPLIELLSHPALIEEFRFNTLVLVAQLQLGDEPGGDRVIGGDIDGANDASEQQRSRIAIDRYFPATSNQQILIRKPVHNRHCKAIDEIPFASQLRTAIEGPPRLRVTLRFDGAFIGSEDSTEAKVKSQGFGCPGILVEIALIPVLNVSALVDCDNEQVARLEGSQVPKEIVVSRAAVIVDRLGCRFLAASEDPVDCCQATKHAAGRPPSVET